MLIDGRDDLVERSRFSSRNLIDVRRWHKSCNVDDGSLRRLMVLSYGATSVAPEKRRERASVAILSCRLGPHHPRGRWQQRRARRKKTESEPSLRLSALLHGGPLSILDFGFWIEGADSGVKISKPVIQNPKSKISLDSFYSIHEGAKRFGDEDAAVFLLVIF